MLPLGTVDPDYVICEHCGKRYFEQDLTTFQARQVKGGAAPFVVKSVKAIKGSYPWLVKFGIPIRTAYRPAWEGIV